MTIHSDGPYVLPGGIEPYRLWFEWLKLATHDEDVRVGEKYSQWGAIWNQSFDDWFEPNWRLLFGVSVVRRLQTNEKANSTDDMITIEIPKRGFTSKIRDQVEAFLNQVEHDAELVPEEAKFSISSNYQRGLLPNLAEERRLLRLYELSLNLKVSDEGDRLKELAKSFVGTFDEWASAEANLGRSVGNLPDKIKGFVDFLNYQSQNPSTNIYEWEYHWHPTKLPYTGADCRDAMHRVWRSVKQQRDAVCKGVFPVEKPKKKRKPK